MEINGYCLKLPRRTMKWWQSNVDVILAKAQVGGYSRPRMWLCMKWRDMVGCMVHTERAEAAAVWDSTSHVTANSAVGAPLRWIFKKAPRKVWVTHSQSPATWAQWVCSRAENSVAWKQKQQQQQKASERERREVRPVCKSRPRMAFMHQEML